MLTFQPMDLTDPVYHPNNKVSSLNKFFASLLNDQRNIPFVHFIILVMLTTLPWAVLLFIPGMFHWWLAGLYFLYNAVFLMGPFILMQHNTAHKKLFINKDKYLNNIIPWILGPFFGLTPETYMAHHIGMHHPENNMDDDESTTMYCQRDSFKDFAKYFIAFFFFGFHRLYIYLKLKKRKRLIRRMLLGEGTYFLLTIILLFINWKASVTVFVIPFVFTRFMMMAGNWAQHAFIDSQFPDNCYKNSITCINSAYNKKCWNDGYHIGHHIYPWMHWTEMPQEFLKNINVYKAEDAIVFRKVDYFAIWFMLMTKNYKRLAKYYVQLNPEMNRSNSDVINLLKERAKKFISK
ncbi:MAG TPA: fatty acid desaturase [Puia sp.]|nr:fatty acid desaturase [Puia sp.]